MLKLSTLLDYEQNTRVAHCIHNKLTDDTLNKMKDV